MKGRYGLIAYIQFLQGCKLRKIEGFIKHELYGSGKDKCEEWWKEIGLYYL